MTRLEVACFNAESAIEAVKNGADRIELCEDYKLGGITPKTDTLKRVKSLSKTPVYVMIRPRGGDFYYSDEEFRKMKISMAELDDAGADGFVFGILTKGHRIDEERCDELRILAGSKPCTFHRAFDRATDLRVALNQLITLGFKTVLTSGGASTACEGLEELHLLLRQAGERITILPGGGIRANNVKSFIPDFNFVHSACVQKGNELLDVKELRLLKAALQF